MSSTSSLFINSALADELALIRRSLDVTTHEVIGRTRCPRPRGTS
jgi:hypothetical protein